MLKVNNKGTRLDGAFIVRDSYCYWQLTLLLIASWDATHLFPYQLKTSESKSFHVGLGGYGMLPVAWNGSNKCFYTK